MLRFAVTPTFSGRFRRAYRALLEDRTASAREKPVGRKACTKIAWYTVRTRMASDHNVIATLPTRVDGTSGGWKCDMPLRGPDAGTGTHRPFDSMGTRTPSVL